MIIDLFDCQRSDLLACIVFPYGAGHESERANSLEVRSEELQLKVEALQRRCRSAEHEVVAQKELIQVKRFYFCV